MGAAPPSSWASTRWVTRTERIPRKFSHGDAASGEDLHPISGRTQITSTKYHIHAGDITMVADEPLSQYPAFFTELLFWDPRGVAFEKKK